MKNEAEWHKEMEIKMKVIFGSIRQLKYGVKLCVSIQVDI
mgnify:CR=1 FL=1